MSVVTPPPPQDQLEDLIPEARARQRKRWIVGAALVAVLAGATLGIDSIVSGTSQTARSRTGGQSGAASLPRCRSGQLGLSWQFTGAGTGHSTSEYTFRNASSTSCTLRGWPSLAVVLRSGRRISEKAGRYYNARPTGQRLPIRTVVLRPGGSASSNELSVNPGLLNKPRDCKLFVRAVLVTPPGAHSPLRWPVSGRYCAGPSLDGVTPVFAGRDSRLWFTR